MIYKRSKRKIADALNNLKFYLSERNNLLYRSYYRYTHKPKKGTLAEFLDSYSRSLDGDITVVQIGANDGMINDPLHKYIKRDGWKGVLLEPQEYLYERYLKPLHANSPGITPICAALGPSDEVATLYTIAFTKMRWATGLASFDKNALQSSFDNGTVAAKCTKYGITLPDDKNLWIAPQTVKIITTYTLLSTHTIVKIDLLQIDTEGYDYEVIKLFDIGTTMPAVIIYEHHHLSEKDRRECLDLLRRYGYLTKQYGADTLAVLHPSAEMGAFVH